MKQIDAVQINLSRSLNTLSHKRMVEDRIHCHVHGELLDIFKAFQKSTLNSFEPLT